MSEKVSDSLLSASSLVAELMFTSELILDLAVGDDGALGRSRRRLIVIRPTSRSYKSSNIYFRASVRYRFPHPFEYPSHFFPKKSHVSAIPEQL